MPKTMCELDTGEEHVLPRVGKENSTADVETEPICRAPARPQAAGLSQARSAEAEAGPPQDPRVLTSVCALGSPALAFSRISSKGVSLPLFSGPLTQVKTDGCHKASPRHLSEERRGQQEGAAGLQQLPRLKSRSGAAAERTCRRAAFQQRGQKTLQERFSAAAPVFGQEAGEGRGWEQVWACVHWGSRKSRGLRFESP